MEKNLLLVELAKNCEGKKQKLLDLLKVFDLAELGYEIQEQACTDCYTKVLSENEFLCTHGFAQRTGIKVGERVTNGNDLFLLSDKDFDKVMELARPILVKRKITDADGYYLQNWISKKVEARRELVEFILTEILPESMRKDFNSCRHNIIYSDKLINAFRNSLKSA